MEKNTPYPGIEISKGDAQPIIDKFIEKYRGSLYENMPDNVPTSCTLKGVINLNIFTSDDFIKKSSLYVLFEEPYMLLMAKGEEVSNFHQEREPWEDYDYCVFDETLEWCIGVTHNDDVVVVGNFK